MTPYTWRNFVNGAPMAREGQLDRFFLQKRHSIYKLSVKKQKTGQKTGKNSPKKIFFYFGLIFVPTQMTDVNSILVRFQKSQKLASLSGLQGTPSSLALTCWQFVQVVCACASRLHRRSSLQRRWNDGLPSRTRTARTSPCPPAPWVQGSVSGADVFHPLTKLLEHGYKVRLLVMKNKAQLKEVMVVILQ